VERIIRSELKYIIREVNDPFYFVFIFRSDFIYDMLETLKKKEDPNPQKQRSKKPKKATVSSQFKVYSACRREN